MDDRYFNYYDSLSKGGLLGIIEDAKETIKRLSVSDTPQSPYLYEHYQEKLRILEELYQEKFEEEY